MKILDIRSTEDFENKKIDCVSQIDFLGDFYDTAIESKFSNLGLRLGYFLWNFRGSNDLRHLTFYCNNIKSLSDDDLTLRGAYGPRIRQWVGADQLQEAINKNQDIDKEDEYKKPEGIDQLEQIVNDLKHGLPACIQIFDPSIDFEDSKFIPDLISVGFCVNNQFLDIKMFFNVLDINGFFINDIFFMNLLGHCISNLLEETVCAELGVTTCFANKIIRSSTKNKITDIYSNVKILLPKNKTSESLSNDIYKLSEMERHLRSCISKESIEMETVDVCGITDKLCEKFIGKIKDQFWKEYGFALIAYAMLKYGKKRYINYIESTLISQINSPFKTELLEIIKCHNSQHE